MFAHGDARIDVGVEQRARLHCARFGLDAYPVSLSDAAPRGGLRQNSVGLAQVSTIG